MRRFQEFWEEHGEVCCFGVVAFSIFLSLAWVLNTFYPQ